jgi:ketosteroid isomerase-like protein
MSLVNGVRFRGGTSIEVAECERSHLRLGTAAATDDGPVLVNLLYTTEMTIRLLSAEPNSQGLGEFMVPLEIPATTLLEHDADYFEPMVLESPVERVLREIERAYPQPVMHTPLLPALQGLQFPLIDERILNSLRGLSLPLEGSAPPWTEAVKGIDFASVMSPWTEAVKGIDFASVMSPWTEAAKGIDFASVMSPWTEAVRGIDFATVVPTWTEFVKAIKLNLEVAAASDVDANLEEEPESTDDEQIP